MRLTFIEAASGTPLVKKFTNDKTIPYPNVAAVNSYEYVVTPDDKGLQDFYDLLQKSAPKGWAMLRGPLVKELSNESRRGQHDKSALTQRITLDFDGIDTDVAKYVQHDASGVRTVAEHLLAELPQEFSDVSYIASASSSFGTKPGSVSMHVELLLDAEVSPVELKRYLQQLNFDCPFLKERITLSSNALALRWPLDVSVADNSKIIFIGTPVFAGVQNPFENDENRIIFVQKQRATLDSAVVRAVSGADVRVAQNDLIKELRRGAGMRAKTPRLKQVAMGGEPIEVITNPEEAEIKIDSDEGDYIRANVNGGDSGAYWWPKANPEYVFNFKGEPAFKMKDAAAAFYHQYKDTYRDYILQSAGLDAGDVPIVFREPVEDVYYSMIYNESDDQIKHFAPIGLVSVDNFMRSWGQDKPEVLPEYTLEFKPTTNTQFDAQRRWVNKFRPTKFMLATDLPDQMNAPTEYGTMSPWVEKLAPSFFYNIKHVLGNADSEVEHFLNWLAHVLQTREKTGTAWILLGRTGTGKGLMFDMFFRKVFGEYAKTAKTDTIDDDKNGFLEDTLLLFVDEFKEHDGKSSSRLHNVIKNMVTEKSMTIRHMRQTAKTVRNYTNFVFTTNELDIMTITDDDRRFNIGSRQDRSITEVYPQLPKELDDDDQLMKLCQILNNHKVDKDQVHILIENSWRSSVQISSMSGMNQFFHALQRGNADFFVEEVLQEGQMEDWDPVKYSGMRDMVIRYIANAKEEEPMWVGINELRAIYNSVANKQLTSAQFKAAIMRKGFSVERPRVGERRVRAIEVNWKMEIYAPDEILNEVGSSQQNVSSLEDKRAARKAAHAAAAKSQI